MFEAIGSSWSWFPSFRRQKKLEPYMPKAERKLQERVKYLEWVMECKDKGHQELWEDYRRVIAERDALRKERDQLQLEKDLKEAKRTTQMNRYLAELYDVPDFESLLHP